jgi:hypothetical protein
MDCGLASPYGLVEAWMIQIAWEWLTSHGSLTNRFLLGTDGPNVKRYSFVCALLAQLRHSRSGPSRVLAFRDG